MSQQPDRFYFGIHALRGVAAMLVLLSHAIHLANVAAASAHKLPIGIGRLGVMIFFSISGFVIALNRHQDVREFALRRFIRIYPTNWIALILAGMMMPLIGSAISLDIRSIFLVPTPSSGWSGTPNWTLVYEVAFYAIAAGLFAMRLSDRTLSIICILWVAAINLIAPDITRKEIWQVTTNILWSPLMQALPIGFLCALHFNRLSRIPPALLIAIAILAFAVALHLPDPTNNRYFFYSVATTSLVVALADRVPYNRIAALFGNASYGIYLIHVAVLLLITHSGLVTGKS
ncbi:MAG: acyltransferase family protein, partial [Pseudorhodoplanes sp.]